MLFSMHSPDVVLLAHNGFAFDFPVLFAEVERRPSDLAVADFERRNIHFSDTLPLLRKVIISVLEYKYTISQWLYLVDEESQG